MERAHRTTIGIGMVIGRPSLLVFMSAVRLAFAGPVQSKRSTDQSNTSNDPSLSPKEWIPILIGAIVVIGAVALIVRHRVRSVRDEPTSTSRELTAEQLAGGAQATRGTGGNGNINVNGTGNNGGSAPRRPRRTRRTPSQMSTTSLPAYNKDAGDQELVIYRGTDDMEDADITAQVTAAIMAPLPEGEMDNDNDNDNDNENDMTPDSPLLRNADSPDDPRAPRLPAGLTVPSDGMPTRPSMDTLPGTDEYGSASALVRRSSIDPRGEAPPYESIDLNDPDPPASASPQANTNAATPASTISGLPSQTQQQPRHSIFRGLFQPRQTAVSAPSTPPSRIAQHTRDMSNATSNGSSSGHGHGQGHTSSPSDAGTGAGSRFRPSHRPSHSGGSGTVLNRTLSRIGSRSTLNHSASRANLTSPSMISLHSISAPLPHTLTRTEIVYPRSGPTPEQVRLISSRESLGLFGRPYGAEAIAFAASASRQDLNLSVPPPDFESVARMSADAERPGTSGSGLGVGQSGVRSGSSLAGARSRTSLHHARSASSLARGHARGDSSGSSEESGNAASPPAITTATNANAGQQPQPMSDSPTDMEKSEEPDTDTSVPAPATNVTAPTPATSPSATPHLPSSAPSAFRAPEDSPAQGAGRAESRASSRLSFATAAESLAHTAPGDSASEGSASEPSTPRLGPMHLAEGTDATVTPANANQ